MANSAKEKFDAAVKVIHSLPKDGPFQPSYDMMLNFYSYFKQATEGKCSRPKPWAWDVVNKKKWDAWTRLEDMPREEAMVKYVEELKKTIKHFTEKGLAMKEQGDPRIVEAMPQNEEVRDFMEKLGSFYEIVDEESPIPKPPTESHQPPRPQENNIPSDNETTEGKTPLEIFDHSQVVENVLKKSEEINNILDQSEKVLQNGIDGDKEDENDDSTDTIQQLAVVNAKVQMKEKDVITMNGDHVHVAEWRPTEEARPQGENGSTASGEQTNRVGHPSLAREHRTNRNRRLMSGDHLTSETDSEEEFCDTSDQPSQDETDAMGVHPTMVNSTPIKSGISLGNHMPFGSLVHTYSSLPFTPSKGNLLDVANGNKGMTDSLVVNAPGQDTLDLFNGKDEDQSIDRRDINFNSSNLEGGYDKDVRALGGGDMSPPGGYSQGQGRPNIPQNVGGRQMGTRQNQQGIFSGSQGYYGTGGGGGGRDNEELPVGASSGSIETQMALALVRLQQDMNNVVERVNNLEKAQREQGRNEDQKKEKGIFHWWSFDFNRRSLFAILVWPLIVHWILLKLFHRRRHRPQK
ncbi:acyl-CoA-binding domain-containing protein 5-like isoform X3 [Ostrea edulis]|uniref:acyl-CoA-binding domain-containing protein 5-like isoform X3 n=1 Tax=Ostrea edulis TaxID=37623 RepID=UPI0024AECA03|nr:acyl-CoA-binding domain-containing protein 5-like isoform X3 [Ostrea edulis]